jgi:hypothetical protein
MRIEFARLRNALATIRRQLETLEITLSVLEKEQARLSDEAKEKDRVPKATKSSKPERSQTWKAKVSNRELLAEKRLVQDKILAVLRAHPDGIKAIDLGMKVGVWGHVLAEHLNVLLLAKVVKREGKQYFLADDAPNPIPSAAPLRSRAARGRRRGRKGS